MDLLRRVLGTEESPEERPPPETTTYHAVGPPEVDWDLVMSDEMPPYEPGDDTFVRRAREARVDDPDYMVMRPPPPPAEERVLPSESGRRLRADRDRAEHRRRGTRDRRSERRRVRFGGSRRDEGADRAERAPPAVEHSSLPARMVWTCVRDGAIAVRCSCANTSWRPACSPCVPTKTCQRAWSALCVISRAAAPLCASRRRCIATRVAADTTAHPRLRASAARAARAQPTRPPAAGEAAARPAARVGRRRSRRSPRRNSRSFRSASPRWKACCRRRTTKSTCCNTP